MPGDRVAGPALDLVDHGLELVVGEGLDLAAAVADEVMVMLPGRQGGLVARGARADVDPLQEPALGELVEHAVHGRDAHAPPFAPQPVEDLLRGQAALLTSDQIDHRSAGAAAAAVRLERRDRFVAPALHSPDHSENQYR